VGYYFVPDAIASITDIENEEEKHRAEDEAGETEVLREAGRGAALPGGLEMILSLSPTQFEYTMATILRMLGMNEIQRAVGRVTSALRSPLVTRRVAPRWSSAKVRQSQDDWFSRDAEIH